MPMREPGHLGNGEFTNPDMTMEGMVDYLAAN